jgi:16S rRNA (adenine1518-N6/adenine1519-N6)-dimethyltransferase
MKISNPDQIKNYLRSKNIKPKDYMGQNFLIDEDALAEIIKVAELKASDTILEVGPGLGFLTEELLPRVKEVVAVERDLRLFGLLRSQKLPKLKLVNQDILGFNLPEHIQGPYKVVANIPYYLTSKLLQLFLEQKNRPTMLVLMVQKEVGQRVTAEVGELSILGISVQIYSDAEIAVYVPKTSFWPEPEVDSVVIKITPKDKYPQIVDKKAFFRIVKMAFAGKRKQILNSLANGLHLSKAEVQQILDKSGIPATTRPQDISIDQWISLNKYI